MVRRVRSSVVRIESGANTGSGVIFETQGQTAYVVTNHHVVGGSGQVDVMVNDSATYRGTVRGTDHVRDLAVVSICCGSFHALPFGDASSLEPGDEVIAIGYALGLSGQATITRGIVSAMRYDSKYSSDVIQTDAAINPGNSGGPMLSMSGEILGINTFRIDESASGRAAEGLGFAVSETTVQRRIPTLKTVLAAPTPTPTRRLVPTPTPHYNGGFADSFGPKSGELWHGPEDGFIKAEYAGVYLADFLVSATFTNPYSADSNSWDYGFMLRHSDAEASTHYDLIVVTSQGRWHAARRQGRSSETQIIAGGRLGSFDTGARGSNRLWLAAFGERGLLFVNAEFVAMLDLSSAASAGDIAVISGTFTGNEVAGAVTRFEDFTINGLVKRYGPAGGKLQSEPGFVAEHESGLWERDLVAEATFDSPPGRDWDYGFIIRNPEISGLDVIGVTGDGQWFHDTRSVGDDDYTNVSGGPLSVYGATLSSANHLILFAFEDAGLFFVNGQFVARLDLSHNQDYGRVSVMGDYYYDHQAHPRFTNFNVWTP